MVMKLDASDDRGINSVRKDIKGFAEKKNMFQKGAKLIYFCSSCLDITMLENLRSIYT